MRVYPRIRGVDVAVVVSVKVSSGLPPHTRGGSHGGELARVSERFTPAYAGWICNAPISICSISGLPPHTRGGSAPNVRPDLGTGFTPAYAGWISPRLRAAVLSQVYPRIRGVDEFADRDIRGRNGLPPHTRGGYYYATQTDGRKRFTPAYAGWILILIVCSKSGQVYPRIRGVDNRTPPRPASY